MKNLIFVAALLFGHLSFAQFEDKKWIVGGSLGDNIDFSNLTIYPTVAYAIGPNGIIGLSAAFDYYNAESTEVNQNKLDQLNTGISLYYKHYRNLSDKWYFTLRSEGSIGYVFNRNVSENPDPAEEDTKSRVHSLIYSIGAIPGLTYQPKEWLLIEASLGSIRLGRQSSEQRSDGEIWYKSTTNFIRSDIRIGGLGVKFIL